MPNEAPKHRIAFDAPPRNAPLFVSRFRMYRVLRLLMLVLPMLGLGETVTAESLAQNDLNRAISLNDLELLKQAVARGADPNFQDRHGRSPLCNAAQGGQRNAVEFLLSKGANPGIGKDPALTCAAGGLRAEHAQVLTVLLDAGAAIDQPRYDGLTALDLSVMHGTTEEVRVLLSRGARANSLSPEGHTPLDWAIYKKRSDVEELLRSYGGNVGCSFETTWAKREFGLFGLQAFPPAALIVFVICSVMRRRVSVPISPLVFAYAGPVLIFSLVQLRYACGAKDVLYGVPVLATAAVILQSAAILRRSARLMKYALAVTVLGLLLLSPSYLVLLAMMLGAGDS